MSQILFQNGVLLDPERSEPVEGRLLVRNGRIAAVLGEGDSAPEGAQVVDLGGRALAPGFIDVHFHGRTIFDAAEAPAASMRHDAASMLRHGVTGFLPTTVALGAGELRQRVIGIAEAVAAHKDGATPLGIHLEGPWISAEAPGAQPRDAIRAYDPKEGAEVLDAGEGMIRMVTLATEIPGAGALIETLHSRGVIPALGHTRADAETANAGFDRGVSHVTHLFNAMGAFHHRDPGAIGAALGDDRVSCDLICDGVHVHPAAVRAAARAKGDRLVLITDAIDPGDPDDSLAVQPLLGDGTLAADGPVWRLPGGTLAGSRLGLAAAVHNATGFGGMTRLEAVAAATLRPATLLGVEAERGTLRTGARGDFVVLDSDGRVASTWLAGEVAYSA